MKHILPILIFSLVVRSLPAAELLKNGDFETGDITGWNYWETYPWDGDGAPVESPTHVTIAIPGNIGTPIPPTTSGFFALTQQVTHNATARGGLYQEVKVVVNTPYILTGHMAFYGDDIGDVTVVGILDGSWNPAIAFTTIKKNYMGGNTVSSWMEFSLMIIPSKDVIAVFTETRQDWTHGNVAGWYDNLSLRPVPEPTKLLTSQHLRDNLIQKEKQIPEKQITKNTDKKF
ncbi:MAG TPA: hypothetical protein ACFYEK_05470 [Candidatus Wunengus sp. YC60]|uniref:hypothetical protein n=1 Tax=Candidatus Wunengus sp. YC60 TaxID=3367697 RepID=UPI00402A29B5